MTKEELFSISITEPDPEILKQSKAKWDGIAKPIDGLGSFEEIICRIAAVQENVIPAVDRKAHIIMCADNGIFEEGVSQTSRKVTRDVAELMGQRNEAVLKLKEAFELEMV